MENLDKCPVGRNFARVKGRNINTFVIYLAGIYLHIPFCKKACNYCDFYFSTHLQNKPQLVTSITHEIVKRHNYLLKKELNSIYFGGGTPSLLSQTELQTIFAALSRFFIWHSDTEVTLEANPDDINPLVLQQWRELGINRLSIGLQSFEDAELKWMNRAHTAAESLVSVKMAQEAGFNNLTIDLIYGSKFQTLKSWENTLHKAVELGTQHISAYNLTIEDRTVLGNHHKKGAEPAIDDELSKEQFLMMVEILTNAGFEHYEVSNFAQPGFRARHNSNYWLQESYLGLGPSAHSFNGETRQWNVRNTNQYIKALSEGGDFFEQETLSARDKYNEYVLTRLRTVWGCDLDEIRKTFGESFATQFQHKISEEKEYVIEENGVYTLNTHGKLRADGIASSLFVV